MDACPPEADPDEGLPPFAVGARYNSFEDIKKAIEIYEEKNKVFYVRKRGHFVSTFNARRKPTETAYREELVYTQFTYECKQFGKVRSDGAGIRPQQASLKTGCRSYATISAIRGPNGYLHVVHFQPKHEEHEVSAEVYETLPGVRNKISSSRREAVHIALDCNVPAASVAEFLRQYDGIKITAKDIQNLKYHGPEEDVELHSTMRSILARDEKAVFLNTLDKNGKINFVFFQSGEMKRNLGQFPEIIGMDTTYNVNHRRMQLNTLMVIDGDGKGRVVAHALISDELGETYLKLLTVFKQLNPEDTKSTQVFVTDKDTCETNAIQAVFPNVARHLCVFHVMKAVVAKLKTYHLSKEDLEELTNLVRAVVLAKKEFLYTDAKNELYQSANDNFIAYFERNWHGIGERWSEWQRAGVPTFGTTTTNHLESFHAKIKNSKVVDPTYPLHTCVRKLYNYTEKVSRNKREENAQARAKVHYNLNDCCPIVKSINNIVERQTAAKMLDHLKKVKKKKKYFKLLECEGGVHKVQSYGTTHTVTLTETDYHCTCTLHSKHLLPCYHLYYLLVEKQMTLLPAWISNRFHRSVKTTLPFKQVPESYEARFEMLAKYTKDIISTIAASSKEEFIHKMTLLHRLYTAWLNGWRAVVTVPELGNDTAAGQEQKKKGTKRKSEESKVKINMKAARTTDATDCSNPMDQVSFSFASLDGPDVPKPASLRKEACDKKRATTKTPPHPQPSTGPGRATSTTQCPRKLPSVTKGLQQGDTNGTGKSTSQYKAFAPTSRGDATKVPLPHTTDPSTNINSTGHTTEPPHSSPSGVSGAVKTPAYIHGAAYSHTKTSSPVPLGTNVSSGSTDSDGDRGDTVGKKGVRIELFGSDCSPVNTMAGEVDSPEHLLCDTDSDLTYHYVPPKVAEATPSPIDQHKESTLDPLTQHPQNNVTTENTPSEQNSVQLSPSSPTPPMPKKMQQFYKRSKWPQRERNIQVTDQAKPSLSKFTTSAVNVNTIPKDLDDVRQTSGNAENFHVPGAMEDIPRPSQHENLSSGSSILSPWNEHSSVISGHHHENSTLPSQNTSPSPLVKPSSPKTPRNDQTWNPNMFTPDRPIPVDQRLIFTDHKLNRIPNTTRFTLPPKFVRPPRKRGRPRTKVDNGMANREKRKRTMSSDLESSPDSANNRTMSSDIESPPDSAKIRGKATPGRARKKKSTKSGVTDITSSPNSKSGKRAKTSRARKNNPPATSTKETKQQKRRGKTASQGTKKSKQETYPNGGQRSQSNKTEWKTAHNASRHGTTSERKGRFKVREQPDKHKYEGKERKPTVINSPSQTMNNTNQADKNHPTIDSSSVNSVGQYLSSLPPEDLKEMMHSVRFIKHNSERRAGKCSPCYVLSQELSNKPLEILFAQQLHTLCDEELEDKGTRTRQEEITKVMGLVLAYSYVSLLTWREVLPMVLDIPHDPNVDLRGKRWPRTNTGTSVFRLADQTISATDFKVLASEKQWMSDAHILGYFRFLERRVNTHTPRTVFIVPSFWPDKWQGAHFGRQWLLRQHDLRVYKWLFVPICSDNHWFMLVVDVQGEHIYYLDSIEDGNREKTWVNVFRAFWAHREIYLKQAGTRWTSSRMAVTQQRDGHSCGVFVMMNGAAVLHEIPVTSVQRAHIPFFKKYVACCLEEEMQPNNNVCCSIQYCLLYERTEGAKHIHCGNCNRRYHLLCLDLDQAPPEFMCHHCT